MTNLESDKEIIFQKYQPLGSPPPLSPFSLSYDLCLGKLFIFWGFWMAQGKPTTVWLSVSGPALIWAVCLTFPGGLVGPTEPHQREAGSLLTYGASSLGLYHHREPLCLLILRWLREKKDLSSMGCFLSLHQSLPVFFPHPGQFPWQPS